MNKDSQREFQREFRKDCQRAEALENSGPKITRDRTMIEREQSIERGSLRIMWRLQKISHKDPEKLQTTVALPVQLETYLTDKFNKFKPLLKDENIKCNQLLSDKFGKTLPKSLFISKNLKITPEKTIVLKKSSLKAINLEVPLKEMLGYHKEMWGDHQLMEADYRGVWADRRDRLEEVKVPVREITNNCSSTYRRITKYWP